jgi:hypothetical protein
MLRQLDKSFSKARAIDKHKRTFGMMKRSKFAIFSMLDNMIRDRIVMILILIA